MLIKSCGLCPKGSEPPMVYYRFNTGSPGRNTRPCTDRTDLNTHKRQSHPEEVKAAVVARKAALLERQERGKRRFTAKLEGEPVIGPINDRREASAIPDALGAISRRWFDGLAGTDGGESMRYPHPAAWDQYLECVKQIDALTERRQRALRTAWANGTPVTLSEWQAEQDRINEVQ